MGRESLFADRCPPGHREEGYIEIEGQLVPVWQREVRVFRTVARRETGGAGRRLENLERWLREHPMELAELIKGEVVVYE